MQWVSAFRYSGRADGMTSTSCISVYGQRFNARLGGAVLLPCAGGALYGLPTASTLPARRLPLPGPGRGDAGALDMVSDDVRHSGPCPDLPLAQRGRNGALIILERTYEIVSSTVRLTGAQGALRCCQRSGSSSHSLRM